MTNRGQRQTALALTGAGIEPAVRLGEAADLLTVDRGDGTTDFYYLYNHDGEDARPWGRST
jgi:hypothetical protein